LTDKPLHSIIARPEIKTISDLRRQEIGTNGSVAQPSRAEAILQAKGSILKTSVCYAGRRRTGAREILKKRTRPTAVCSVRAPAGPLAHEGY